MSKQNAVNCFGDKSKSILSALSTVLTTDLHLLSRVTEKSFLSHVKINTTELYSTDSTPRLNSVATGHSVIYSYILEYFPKGVILCFLPDSF